jgi:pSer/pThr/pTyr-binding forkhead associated (FHA) protein
MKPRLVIVYDNHDGKNILATGPRFVIGRDESCDLRPTNRLISRRHCEIDQRDDGAFVKDLDSRNGTYVNKLRVTDEVRVRDGDQIQVGPITYTLKIVEGDGGRNTSTERNPIDILMAHESIHSPHSPISRTGTNPFDNALAAG